MPIANHLFENSDLTVRSGCATSTVGGLEAPRCL